MTLTTLPGASAAEHSGSSPVQDFGDTRAEFQALLSGCGLYDLAGRAKMAVTGGDRVRWLNGMISNNVRDLAPGHGVYAFLLNAQGHIQADLYAFQHGDSLLVDLDRSLQEKVVHLFERYIIADDVEIADVSEKFTALGVAGPESRKVLERAGIVLPELAPLEFCSPKCDCACGCLQCTVVRGDGSAGTSYEIWLAPDQQKSTWDALIAAGATAVGAGALELRRIHFGIPKLRADIRDRDLPQETGQLRALNFAKGCYLGQEIVERIRTRGGVHRQFTAFLVEGALPQPGAKIVADEKDVGEITSSAILPLPGGDRPVALGYVRREAAGKDLRAGTAKLKTASLPMI
ncbi:MAG: folate-binding protein [Terriglobales bacterium]